MNISTLSTRLGKNRRNWAFWFFAGQSASDRLRLLYYWLSPYVLGHHAGAPVPVRTRFLEGRPFFLRSSSTDVRVLRSIFYNGAYDLPSHMSKSVHTILDLGGYTGISAIYFAHRYPPARVLVVEPDSDNFNCLLHNVKELSEAGRVEPFNACVYSRRGTVNFNAEGPSWERSVAETGGIEVPAVTITDLLDEFATQRADILKIDIEGGEKYVFQSIDQWIGRVGWILMEVHFHSILLSEVLAAVSRYGRKVFYKEMWPSLRWIEITPELCSTLEAGAPGLDVIIPPANITEMR